MTIKIMIGDVFAQLKLLPDASVDCVCTSPPYWGLRAYLPDQHPDKPLEIGLERTLGEHLDVLVRVFREVRRVLKPHGTVWLNYGDCYATQPNGRSAEDVVNDDRTFRDKPFSTIGPIYNPGYATARGEFTGTDLLGGKVGTRRVDHGGRIQAGGFLKNKDLCMIPNRLAIALQDDGWWVRSEIIWHKPNPMPESIYDRPTSSHEKIWMLAKSEDYFFNAEALREPVSKNTHARISQDVANQVGSLRANGGSRPDRPMKAVVRAVGPNSRIKVDRVPVSRKKAPAGWDTSAGEGRHGEVMTDERRDASRRDRNDALHVDATARSKKMRGRGEEMIKSNERFAAATQQHVDSRNTRNVWKIAPKAFREAHFATFPPELAKRCIMGGTPPSVCGFCGAVSNCGGICESIPRKPGVVLDPFGGAGTVGLVARELGLGAVLIELNSEYAEMARKRIFADQQEAAE